MQTIHPMALLRLSVLGPLASRDRLEHGDLHRLLVQLSKQTDSAPNGTTTRIAELILHAPVPAPAR